MPLRFDALSAAFGSGLADTGVSWQQIWQPIAPDPGGRSGIRTSTSGPIHAQTGPRRTPSDPSSRPTDQKVSAVTALSWSGRNCWQVTTDDHRRAGSAEVVDAGQLARTVSPRVAGHLC